MEFVQGKVAIIIGGAGKVGFACAIEFFKNGLKGITIVDINSRQGLETVGKINQICGNSAAIFFKADAVVKSEMEEAFKATIDKFQQLDILINNACCKDAPSWKQVIDVNVNGMLHGCALAFEHYLPTFKGGQEGVIVNISTITSSFSSSINPAYYIGKLAAIGMAKTFGYNDHYQKTKVRVMTICLHARIIKECCKKCKPFYNCHICYTPCIGLVGKGINAALTKGINGSIWLLSGNSLTQLHYPTIEEAMTTNRIHL